MRIYVWPDGSWQYADEHCDELDRWKGDDYIEILVDSWWDEEDIDRAAMDAVSFPKEETHND